MITSEKICLLFSVALFWLDLTKGQNDCTLSVSNDKVLAYMPLTYSLDEHERGSILYPNNKGNLTVERNAKLVFSCLSSSFKYPPLRECRDMVVTCIGGTRFRYKNYSLNYANFMCSHMLRSSLLVTKQKCRPGNNTVVRIGFQTRRYFFTLYKACVDVKNKNTLYTWFYARLPFFNHFQQRKRIRKFFQYSDIHGNDSMNLAYGKATQRVTVNSILHLGQNISNYMDDTSKFLTKGHFVAKTDFYFAREQSATFNYVNVFPQWFLSNNVWVEVEESVKILLDRNTYSRRVVISGRYGTFTLPDKNNRHQPLYLVMPEKQVSVPLFLWKMVHDADNGKNSIVFICVNSQHPDDNPVMDHLWLKCDRIPCPGAVKSNQLVYCCNKKSFLREYGKLPTEVFKVPPKAYILQRLNTTAPKHSPPKDLPFLKSKHENATLP